MLYINQFIILEVDPVLCQILETEEKMLLNNLKSAPESLNVLNLL